MQRVHHDPFLLRAHGDEVLAAVERHLADARLAHHPFAHHRERFRGHRTVGREIVRAIDVNRIDLRVVGELHEVDDVRRFDADLLDVFVVDDDVASLLELIAFDQLGVRHLAFAVRAPPLLLDARLALGVELVERDGISRFGRREHLHRDVDQADFQEAFPSRSWRHTSALSA